MTQALYPDEVLHPKYVWASLEAHQVHAGHTLKELGEPPQLKALCETLQWYVESIAEFSSQLGPYTALVTALLC